MLKSTKNNLIINNAIELGENISLEDKGKGRHFTSRFIEAGLAHYQEFGDVLITKETLDKFVYTMVGCPVIIRHKDITAKNVDKERVGVVSKVWYNELDGWFWCEGIIWDKQAIDLIKNQGWSVSCTYDFESDFKKGTYHGKDYDMEFTGGEFLHLALVDNPRYERANIVVNSKDEKGRWVTIKGTHVFIPEGKEVDDVVKEKFSEKGESKDDAKSKESKEAESNTVKETTYEIMPSGYVRKVEYKGSSYDVWGNGNANHTFLTKEEYEQETGKKYDDLSKSTSESKDKLEEKIPFKNFRRLSHEERKERTKELNKYFKAGKMSEDEVLEYLSQHESLKWDTDKREFFYDVNDLEARKKQKQHEEKVAKWDDSRFGIDRENTRVGTWEDVDIYKKIKKEKKETYIDGKTKDVNNLIGLVKEKTGINLSKYKGYAEDRGYSKKNRLYIDFDKLKSDWARKDNNKYQDTLYWLKKYSDSTDNGGFGTFITPKKDDLKANNERNITMTVLNELKEFIQNVVNNKGVDMEEKEKVDNEKVDKRDIIRQIMAIAGKEEASEDVKEIAKLAEKLAYDKSEAGTADNKCKNEEDEEEEEKFEEEKEIANKAKNEEEEKEEEKEEAENEEEEDKEEEKKADNKCKNSLDETRKIVFGGKKVENESKYIPISKRIEMGNQY